MHQQVAGQVRDHRAVAKRNDLLVEADIGFRVLVEMLVRLAVEELREGATQAGQILVRGGGAGEPRRHALQRRPGLDHADDLALRLLDDEHAAPGLVAHEAFLLQHRQRLADRRAAHAERLRQAALIEPHIPGLAVDVHVGDRGFQRLVGQRPQARRRNDRLDREIFHHFGSTLMPMGLRVRSGSIEPREHGVSSFGRQGSPHSGVPALPAESARERADLRFPARNVDLWHLVCQKKTGESMPAAFAGCRAASRMVL